jgi:hypothetical protein
MVHLASVPSAFTARVMAARLGADGIFVELRGAALDAVYPLAGAVDLYVSAEDAEVARELLVDQPLPSAEPWTPRPPGRRSADPTWVYAAALLTAVILGMVWLRELLDWLQY